MAADIQGAERGRPETVARSTPLTVLPLTVVVPVALNVPVLVARLMPVAALVAVKLSTFSVPLLPADIKADAAASDRHAVGIERSAVVGDAHARLCAAQRDLRSGQCDVGRGGELVTSTPSPTGLVMFM